MEFALQNRIDRLYVAMGRVVEHDLPKIPARIEVRGDQTAVIQDFSGGARECELSETLHGLIASIASFPDHLKKWGRQQGISEDSVYNYFKASFDFCVVRDLWNNDKHGYPPRENRDWSKKAPQLIGVRRICRLLTGPQNGSMVTMRMNTDGIPMSSGDGECNLTITGEVVDNMGNGLGEAHDFIEQSVHVCEAALRRFGVTEY